MTLSAAPSTQQPLSRQRDNGTERLRLSVAADVPAQRQEVDGKCERPSPSVQSNEAPRMRRKPIRTNETLSETRQGNLARIQMLGAEICRLTETVVLGADIELLDLMRDEVGSYSRHKAAQEARVWAEQGRLSIETGLMQLERAIRSAAKQG